MNATQNLRNLRPASRARAAREATISTPREFREVAVSCTARLHLGFFDLNFALGRRFGSIGLSLDQPATRIVVRHADANSVTGPEYERVSRYREIMCAYLDLATYHAIHVDTAIPAHAGLGSGTQLALAVAAALRRLHGIPADLRGDAGRLARGARSGIGIGLFRSGGFVVDGGNGAVVRSPPPILAHVAVPETWRVILVMDTARRGLSGDRERKAFDTLQPMASAISGEICRLVLMQALPALHERDLSAFGAAITMIQHHVGDHFAPSQGGRFTSPTVAAVMQVLAAAGAVGIGQTSWGPTGFAFAQNEQEAHRLVAEAAASPAAKGLDLRVCRALNRGALVKAA